MGLPRRRRRQHLGQKRHALHGPHGNVERPRDIHGHGRADGDRMCDIHVRRRWDRREVDWAGDANWMLKVDRGSDVDGAGGNVHLRRDGDGVAGIGVAVSGRSGGRRFCGLCRC